MIKVIQNRLLHTFLHKFSFLFACIYYTIFVTGKDPIASIPLLILAVITAIGVASLGYFLNDLVDLKSDVELGKRNMLTKLNPLRIIIVGVTFFALALAPWIWLPFDVKSGLILLIEILLFVLYSIPPFRLKERGIWGVIVDALYAHTIPCLLAMYTFSGLQGIPEINIIHVLIFGIWLTLSGVRNIFNHQIEDLENDEKSGTITFVVKYLNKKKEINTSLWILIFLEIVLFCLILIPRGLGIIVIVWLFLSTLHLLRNRNHLMNHDTFFSILHHRILNEFYEIIFPVILLTTIFLGQLKFLF